MGHDGQQDIEHLTRDALERAEELVQQVGHTCAEDVIVTSKPAKDIKAALPKVQDGEKKVPSTKALIRIRDAAFDIAVAATWDMQIENALDIDEQKELAYHAIVAARTVQEVLDACH